MSSSSKFDFEDYLIIFLINNTLFRISLVVFIDFFKKINNSNLCIITFSVKYNIYLIILNVFIFIFIIINVFTNYSNSSRTATARLLNESNIVLKLD